MPKGIYIRTKTVWNKGKTKEDFPQLSNSGVKKGNVSHWKGKHHSEETKQLLSEINKGKHFSLETEFKEKIEYSFWKTEKRTTYRNLHRWVYQNLGRPLLCEQCGSSKNIEWANKSQRYLKDITDWLSLCAKCHFRYDQKGISYVI